MRRLSREHALLVVIDVQEKLARVIDDIEGVEKNIERLIRGCHLLGVSALMTEQYPQGLGSTTERLRGANAETFQVEPIQKMCFSSYGCTPVANALEQSGRRQILLCGIEAHVCVWQTTIDLLDAGYDVFVVADAVSSRTRENRELAIARMAAEGARITSTEMALFEMTVEAGTDTFRAISRLVK